MNGCDGQIRLREDRRQQSPLPGRAFKQRRAVRRQNAVQTPGDDPLRGEPIAARRQRHPRLALNFRRKARHFVLGDVRRIAEDQVERALDVGEPVAFPQFRAVGDAKRLHVSPRHRQRRRAGVDADARPDYSSAADDNVIIETISSNDTSFGWVGFAFAVEAEGVKLVQVSEEEGGECVTPTPETIASNEYPIARDLFIYVNADKAAASEDLVAFVDYFMEFGLDQAAADVGYVTLTDEAKEATRSAWSGR